MWLCCGLHLATDLAVALASSPAAHVDPWVSVASQTLSRRPAACQALLSASLVPSSRPDHASPKVSIVIIGPLAQASGTSRTLRTTCPCVKSRRAVEFSKIGPCCLPACPVLLGCAADTENIACLLLVLSTHAGQGTCRQAGCAGANTSANVIMPDVPQYVRITCRDVQVRRGAVRGVAGGDRVCMILGLCGSGQSPTFESMPICRRYQGNLGRFADLQGKPRPYARMCVCVHTCARGSIHIHVCVLT